MEIKITTNPLLVLVAYQPSTDAGDKTHASDIEMQTFASEDRLIEEMSDIIAWPLREGQQSWQLTLFCQKIPSNLEVRVQELVRVKSQVFNRKDFKEYYGI